MHAQTGTAFRAGPSGCILGNETLHPGSLDALQVGEDADPIPRPVADVETKQARAGIAGTGKAELLTACGELITVLDDASQAGVRLVTHLSPATGAGITIPVVGAAQAAIDATRRNDQRVCNLNLHDFVWHTVLPVSGKPRLPRSCRGSQCQAAFFDATCVSYVKAANICCDSTVGPYIKGQVLCFKYS